MKIGAERLLIDANVFIYGLDTESPHHDRARGIFDRAMLGDGSYCVTSQTLVELFSVVTNPRRVKLPHPPFEAVQVIEDILSWPGITHLTLTPEVTTRWLAFIRQTSVRGAKVFDLQLAATALANGVTKIVTFNVADFERIDGIEVIVP